MARPSSNSRARDRAAIGKDERSGRDGKPTERPTAGSVPQARPNRAPERIEILRDVDLGPDEDETDVK